MKASYEEFKEWMLEEVKSRLEENEYVYYDLRNGNMQEESLVIVKKGCPVKFGATVKSMYRAYNSGYSLERIAEDLVEKKELQKNIKELEKIGRLGNYEAVKDDLYACAVAGKQKKQVLERGTYRQIGDIVLGVYLKLSEDEEELHTIMVDRNFLDKWRMTEEAVLDQALYNAMKMAPPRFYGNICLLLAVLTGKCEGVPIEEYYPNDFEREKGCFFSTDRMTNGATAIFYPGVAARVCKALKTTAIYIVPTSIHEAVIHDCRYVEDMNMISDVLQKVINESTPEEEILSRHIFKYELETDQFTEVV